MRTGLGLGSGEVQSSVEILLLGWSAADVARHAGEAGEHGEVT